MDAWYQKWFNKFYLDLYQHRDQKEAAAAVKLVFSHFQPLDPRTPIIDIACGSGRHTAELSAFGAPIVGIDLSTDLIEEANKRGQQQNRITFLKADMRRLPFCDQSFQLAVSFFTSFGYFETRLCHEKLLAEWARILIPGGGLCIDYLNKLEVVENLKPKSERETKQFVMYEKRSLAPGGGRIEKDITILDKESSKRTFFKESVQLFTKEEMEAMLEENGFSLRRVLGSYSGEAFSKQSPRLILFAEKNGTPCLR